MQNLSVELGSLWRNHEFESRLAVVSAVFLGIGWAVITGSQSGLLGRLAFFVIGAGIGLTAGYRFGDQYVDSRPRTQRLLQVLGYLFVVAVTGLAVSPGEERFTVRGAIAAFCFGPTLWALFRNLLSDQGDRRLVVRLIPWVAAGIGLVFLASKADGWQLAAVLGGLVFVSATAIGLDIQRRSEPGGPASSVTTTRLSRWAVGWRALATAACLLVAVVLVTEHHAVDGVECGTVRRALDYEPGHVCERPLRADAISALLLVHGAGFLIYPVIRRHGGPAPGEGVEDS